MPALGRDPLAVSGHPPFKPSGRPSPMPLKSGLIFLLLFRTLTDNWPLVAVFQAGICRSEPTLPASIATPLPNLPDLFSVRDVTWVLSADSVTLTVITDVPCHLWMRWTLTKPRIHSKASVRRGLALMKDVRFCFTTYHDNEQEEDGDTLVHTFLKPDWPVCETRFFYFWGEITGEVSNSTSPLFELHNSFEEPPYPPVPPPDEMWFFPYIHNPVAGRLYIALCNLAKDRSTIYRSENRANSWEAVLDSDSFGGVNHLPWMLAETTAGYLCLVWHKHEIPAYWQLYSAPHLTGPWTVRLGGTGKDGIWRGYPYIHVDNNHHDCWCSGVIGPYAYTDLLNRSANGGTIWAACLNLRLQPQPSMIKVNDAKTWAILGGVGGLATWQCRRSDNPMATPGTWPTLGIAARSRRVAYVHPYVVLPYVTYYQYSTDGGHNFINKDIPVDMQVATSANYSNGLDESDLHSARLLASPHGLGKGVWVSYDWGDSWQKTLDDLGHPVDPYMNNVWWDRHDDTVCYAWGRLGFWRSNDAGLTWTQRNNGLEALP